MRELSLLIPILALLIPIVAIVMRHWKSVRMREMDLIEASRTSLDSDARARLEQLEGRVQVLERIATDKRIALDEEIRRLEER